MSKRKTVHNGSVYFVENWQIDNTNTRKAFSLLKLVLFGLEISKTNQETTKYSKFLLQKNNKVDFVNKKQSKKTTNFRTINCDTKIFEPQSLCISLYVTSVSAPSI